MSTYDLILKNGVAVLPSGLHKTDIAISNGKIAAFGNFAATQAEQVLECAGLHILPGVIDTQVHFREPGAEHKEDLHTGSKAAVLGGVTSVFEMPNTKPLTTTPEALADKLARAKGRMYCDHAFFFGATAQNADQLPEWENLPGVCGVKIFMGSSTGDLLVDHDEDVRRILQNGKRVVSVHSEDEAMMLANKAALLAQNPAPNVREHCNWRSVESCVSSTTRLLRLARETNRRVHVLHICTAEELPILAEYRDVATCEVLPNHLTLHAPECYETLGSLAQQNPPIREKRHQEALWQAVKDGLIDILGSDHAPHTLPEKAQAYPASPSGTPGVQTMLPIMLDHVAHNRLTLERLVDLTAYGPQRVFGIKNKGRIALGYDADFAVVDLKAPQVLTNEQQASKAGWTPYNGREVRGVVLHTVLRGQAVVRERQLVQEQAPQSQVLSFFH